jgi:hypothetical protein
VASGAHEDHNYSILRIPVTEDAVSQRFGTAVYTPLDQFEELEKWKEEGLEGHERHLERTAKIAAEKRAVELAQYHEQVTYVENRSRDLNRKYQRNLRHSEQAEADRLELRKLQKEERRAKRIAGYEAAETSVMMFEDQRSAQHRFFIWETARILEERENMFNEELDQTEVDNFWGFPTDARLKAEERDRQQYLYNCEVDNMRVKCVEAQIIRPYGWEADQKLYRDFYSHKPLK